VHDRPKPADAPAPRRNAGAEIILSGNWRNTPDDWNNREQRQRLQRLETYLAAGVIARYLGPDWNRRTNEHGNIEIVHRAGYGFRLTRPWNDSTRFESSPIDTYTRNDPPSITTSATRPLGAIARDIEHRLIGNGLAEAYRQVQQRAQAEREERRKRFRDILDVARAFGGRILPARNWKSSAYPEARIPGGTARCYYDNRIQLDLTITAAQATALGGRSTTRPPC
jgi:hypothetical protein